MPEYVFKIQLPSPIPEDILRTELDKFIRELVKKYGVYEVSVKVTPKSPDADVEVEAEAEDEEPEESFP